MRYRTRCRPIGDTHVCISICICQYIYMGISLMNVVYLLQTTQPTRGGAVTADSSCCANCVEPPRPEQWGPDLPFLGMAVMRTRWMAGAVAHKSG